MIPDDYQLPLLPIPAIGRDVILPPLIQRQVPMEPQYQKIGRLLPRIPYKGIQEIMEGQPINIHFQGKVPRYQEEPEEDLAPLFLTDEDKTRKPKRLFQDVEDISIRRKHLPKQHDIDKFWDRLRKKVIHQYETPITKKELRAAYLKDPEFKDVYIYITRGYCMYKGYAQKTFKSECEDYITYQGLLFKIVPNKRMNMGPKLLLCVPQVYILIILYQYHEDICSCFSIS